MSRLVSSPSVLPDENRSRPEIPRSGLLFRDSNEVDRDLSRSLTRWDKIAVRGSWLANSHPKSGTYLLRNILMHFNSAAVHQEMLFYDTFADGVAGEPLAKIYSGHVPYQHFATSPASARLRTILLVRHPLAIAPALARAFYDVNTTRPDHLHLREHDTFEQIVVKVIGGYECAGLRFAPLATSLAEFAVDWLGNVDFLLRFEEITERLGSNDQALVAYFAPLLTAIFGEIPADAAARIRAGAAAGISATFSRTQAWARRDPAFDEIYSLLPSMLAADLQEIARRLGY